VQLCESGLVKKIKWRMFLPGGCRCEHCIQKRLGCINVLMSRGANPDAEDKNGETPLYYAARNRLAECATLLLEKGSDLQHW